MIKCLGCGKAFGSLKAFLAHKNGCEDENQDKGEVYVRGSP